MPLTPADSLRLTVIETILTRMDHALFGNGQPGAIRTMEHRILKLENWRWYVMGIAIGSGGIVGAFIMHMVEGGPK